VTRRGDRQGNRVRSEQVRCAFGQNVPSSILVEAGAFGFRTLSQDLRRGTAAQWLASNSMATATPAVFDAESVGTDGLRRRTARRARPAVHQKLLLGLPHGAAVVAAQ
jgi:hypothetical protein